MAVSWMKTGAESQKLAQQAEAEAEKRKAEMGKMFRFWMNPKEEKKITFVDGELDPQGFLNPPRFYEHNLFMNGNWGNHFVCPEKTDPSAGHKCPICEGGDRPMLVALFTVIDHSKYTSAKGKVYENTRKLFVATPGTFEILNKLAVKRGGLVGATFDVSRSKDKSPRVGDLFDFIEKNPVEALKTKYTRTFKDNEGKQQTVCDFTPADYDTEIVYRTPEELAKLGLGNASDSTPNMGGSAQGQTGNDAKPAGEQDYGF